MCAITQMPFIESEALSITKTNHVSPTISPFILTQSIASKLQKESRNYQQVSDSFSLVKHTELAIDVKYLFGTHRTKIVHVYGCEGVQ